MLTIVSIPIQSLMSPIHQLNVLLVPARLIAALLALVVLLGSAQAPPIITPANLLSELARAQPGSTVWLSGGTYTMPELEIPTGVLLRAQPNERVTFDNVLLTLSDEAGLWGVEITHSSALRLFDQPGSTPPNDDLGNGVYSSRSGVRLINNIIHNTQSSAIQLMGAGNSTVYGNITFDYGWSAPDRGHGHGLYTHNRRGGLRVFEHNIFLPGFGNTAQSYSGGINDIRDYLFTENVFVGGRVVVYSPLAPAANVELRGNHFYRTRSIELGRFYANEDLRVIGNRIYDADNNLTIRLWDELEVRDNVFVGSGYVNTTPGWSLHNVDQNQWFSPNGIWLFHLTRRDPPESPFWTHLYADSIVEVQGFGFEQHSSFTEGLPPDEVFVYPNQYEDERGHVVVWNWSLQPTVTVDLSALNLTRGATYRAHNAHNIFDEWHEFTYTGAPIDLPMTGWSVTTPRGWDVPLAELTFPEFGAFVVLRAGALGG